MASAIVFFIIIVPSLSLVTAFIWFEVAGGSEAYDDGRRDGYRFTHQHDYHRGPNRWLYNWARGKKAREDRKRDRQLHESTRRAEIAKAREARGTRDSGTGAGA